MSIRKEAREIGMEEDVRGHGKEIHRISLKHVVVPESKKVL